MPYHNDEYDDWDDDRRQTWSRRRRYDDYEESPFYRQPRHSGLGVASFVLGLLSGLFVLLLLLVAVVLTVQAGGELDEESSEAMLAGGALIFALLGALTGAILGGIALAQRDRKKVFAILGLCFNLLVLLGGIGVIVLGLALG